MADSIPETRQEVVFAAFAKFDHDGSGNVDAADLKGIFSAHLHPKVISGEMSEDEVYLEFLTHFGDKNRDGKIDWNEWCEYYAGISAKIPIDAHFNTLMVQAWKLDQ